MHSDDTPQAFAFENERDDVHFFVFEVRVGSSRIRHSGIIPYTIHVFDDPRFGDMMMNAVFDYLRKEAGDAVLWEMVRWTTVKHTDELDEGMRFVRGMPPLEWHKGRP